MNHRNLPLVLINDNDNRVVKVNNWKDDNVVSRKYTFGSHLRERLIATVGNNGQVTVVSKHVRPHAIYNAITIIISLCFPKMLRQW